MMLSRSKPTRGEGGSLASAKEKEKTPELEDFLEKRDYTGALAHLIFERDSGKADGQNQLWLAYCYFHAGEYQKAMEEYEQMLSKKGCPPKVSLYLAICQFYLGMYDEASQNAEIAGKSTLQNRLLFHATHKLGDERRLMAHHQQLQDELEDQMCLASIHYMRSHYQEAIDLYKRILLNNRSFLALNVYLALCYYKLDYYDISLEVLQQYLQQNPESSIGLNLKACNHFKLYNGRAAEAELNVLKDASTPSLSFAREIIAHNLVAFRDGEGALQILPPLVNAIPEARLNLAIYHLKRDEVEEAFQLVKDLEPTIPPEYIVKAIVLSIIGQRHMSRDQLKLAQQYYQLVGGSAAECDTIPGRQCMASCYFLMKQYEEVLVYLNSIKNYFYNDDSFHFNYGQAQAALRHFKEAEEALSAVQSTELKNDYVYRSTMARCHIMNKKPRLAWEAYVRMQESPDSFALLQLIANDCYRMGEFFYAVKAFDVLEKLDHNPEYWEGLRGSVAGVLQMVVANKESSENLRDAVQLLRDSKHPQADQIIKVIVDWGHENRLLL